MGSGRRRRPAARRRRLVDHWNEDRDQISLAPGSAEYREYVNDRMGVDDEDFVQDDVVADSGDERRPDEVLEAPAEPEHTAGLAESLAAAADARRRADAEVAVRKYGRRMLKVARTDEMIRAATAAAAETPSVADDKRVAHIAGMCPMSLPEVQDDGVGPDDYIPRSLARYLD